MTRGDLRILRESVKVGLHAEFKGGGFLGFGKNATTSGERSSPRFRKRQLKMELAGFSGFKTTIGGRKKLFRIRQEYISDKSSPVRCKASGGSIRGSSVRYRLFAELKGKKPNFWCVKHWANRRWGGPVLFGNRPVCMWW